MLAGVLVALQRRMRAVQDPQARDESSRRAQARYASYLAFNFGASIATIFLGKVLVR